MVIKIDVPLRNMDGDVMKDNDGTGNVIDATVRLALVNAILSPVERESGTKKVEKYELARKIHKAESEVELTVEEISLAKERIGEVFPALIVGQMFNILEGKE